VVVAAGKASLDQERAELETVETEPGRLLRDLRSADVNRRGVFEQLLLDAVAVEPGEHDQLQRNGCRREPSGFEVAGVQLDVRSANIG
jgi:hypothetical protein